MTTSRRKSNISNFASDTESLNAKDLIYVIRKQSQHSQNNLKQTDDNLQILENKIKKHSFQTDKEFDNNGLWSISNQQIDLSGNRISDDDLDKNEQFLISKEQHKLNASDLEHRSNQYLNKRLPWYCESSSPIKWFKQYSNDQLPKVNYNQKLIDQEQLKHHQQQGMIKPLINLETNDLEFNNINNNFDTNSIQTYIKDYPTKEEPKQLKIQPNLRFGINQSSHTSNQLNELINMKYRSGNHSSIGTNSKPQSTQNYYRPFNYNFQFPDQNKQWRKLSLPHIHPNLYYDNQKFLGGSLRSSYRGRRNYSNKNRFKFNPFSSFYKPRSTNYAGLNEMFADSSVPGVREICHSDGYFRKFIWVIAFFLFSFLALNDIQQLLSDFYSYPITVDMRLRESRKLPFPSITICNLNIVRYSALCNSTYNVSMPVELQGKLCGTNLSQMKNTSIDDINDILPDSDQTQSTKPPTFDDYLNYDDEIANEQTNGPETTFHPNRKKGKTTHKPKFKKQHRLKRSPPASGTGGSGGGSGTSSGGKSHGQPGTVPNVNANSNLNKASPSPPEFSPEIEMFELTEREEKELQENLTTWLAVMANKNKNLTFSLGHQFDDMVLRCTIKSANCTHPNSFVSSFTPTEGNCYTFVAKTNMNPSHTHPTTFGTTVPITSTTTMETTETTDSSSTVTEPPKINPPLQAELFTTTEPPDSTPQPRSTTTTTTQVPNRIDPGGGGLSETSSHHQIETILAGADHGLELVINLEKSEYLPGTSQIGALVMVHSPDDFGISASEAIMVSPECATYIGLKMVRISRLPAPYPEQCIDYWPKGLQRKSMLNVRTIQTRCKCQSAFLEQVELNGTEFRICDTRKRNTRRCVEEVMLRPENKLEDCKCPPRCQVIQYEKTVSVARWPTREDRVSFDRGTKDINISNVAKVVVYFQTMTLQEVTQQSAWTTAKLFSSLGGFMGMYVGFSFLSLFEVFEILSRRIWYSFTRKVPSFKSVANAVLSAIVAKNQIKKNQDKVSA